MAQNEKEVNVDSMAELEIEDTQLKQLELLYSEVFNEDGSPKVCGREKTMGIISYLETLTGLEGIFGNSDNGMMKSETIKGFMKEHSDIYKYFDENKNSISLAGLADIEMLLKRMNASVACEDYFGDASKGIVYIDRWVKFISGRRAEK